MRVFSFPRQKDCAPAKFVIFDKGCTQMCESLQFVSVSLLTPGFCFVEEKIYYLYVYILKGSSTDSAQAYLLMICAFSSSRKWSKKYRDKQTKFTLKKMSRTPLFNIIYIKFVCTYIYTKMNEQS